MGPGDVAVHFGSGRALNLRVGYDRTENVLWCLREGLFPVAARRTVVVLIGTNNLGVKQSSPDVALGVADVVRAVRARAPETHILLLSILPRRRTGRRGDDERGFHRMRQWRSSGVSRRFGPLPKPDGALLDEAFQADKLHLSAKGYELLSSAIDSKLNEAG